VGPLQALFLYAGGVCRKDYQKFIEKKAEEPISRLKKGRNLSGSLLSLEGTEFYSLDNLLHRLQLNLSSP